VGVWTVRLSVGKSAWRAKRVIAEVRSGVVGWSRLLPRRDGHRGARWRLEPIGPLSVLGRRMIWMGGSEGRGVGNEDIIASRWGEIDVGEIA
jgi:hypothetical protein